MWLAWETTLALCGAVLLLAAALLSVQILTYRPGPDEADLPVHPWVVVAVLAAVFLAGFCALALEVLWTRVLVFVLETSAYAFTCMLTCFVFGLALGSLAASRILVPRIKNPLFVLGIIEFLLGLAVTGSIYVLGFLWSIDLFIIERLPMGHSLLPDMTVHFIDTLTVVFIPTLLMGMVFPVAIEACNATKQSVGRRVGQVYAWNTVGCVLGSFAAGFILIPLLGLRDSFLGVIAILLLLAAGLIGLSGKRRQRWAMAKRWRRPRQKRVPSEMAGVAMHSSPMSFTASTFSSGPSPSTTMRPFSPAT